MKTTKKHFSSTFLSTAVLFAAALLHCSQAGATTVMYNFDEAGWVNNFGTTEDFSGSFTGTLEASGALALGDLTGFAATITETNAQAETKTIATFTGVTQFLFDPTTNTLDLAATGTPGAQICLGAAVTEGVCGPVAPRPVNMQGIPAPPIEGIFISSVNGDLSAFTTNLPTVTLDQTTLNPGSAQAPGSPLSSTPEPASSLLCGSALLLVSLVLRRSGRSDAR